MFGGYALGLPSPEGLMFAGQSPTDVCTEHPQAVLDANA